MKFLEGSTFSILICSVFKENPIIRKMPVSYYRRITIFIPIL